MKENVIARRYARGLIEVAVERDELAKVREDLENLADLLDPERGEISVPELLDFLGSPTVPVKEKIQLTDVICEKMQIGKTVSDFLNVLIKKNRVALTGFIAREFERIGMQYETIRNAYVETARPLTDEQKKALEEALQTAFGSKVRLFERRNQALLGGMRVRVEDLLFEDTLEGRLERIQQRIG